MLIGRALAALVIAAAPAAAIPADSVRATGAVTGLRIVPGTGHAEVVVETEGMVAPSDFTLSDPHRVVLDVSGATLAATPTLYDRIARGGITNVRMAQYRPDVVRIVLDLDGPHDYTVTRGDRDLRVAIEGAADFAAWSSSAAAPATRREQAVSAAVADAAGPTFGARRPVADESTQPRITVTYQDADLREVIAAFAAFSGRTIVAGRAVTGTVSYLDIRDKPWDVAFRAVLESQGLAASEDASGIIRVDSYVNILSKQASEPLQTQMVRLNYANSASLLPTIRALLSRDCSGAQALSGQQAVQAGNTQGRAEAVAQGCIVRGAVVADSGTNALLITDVPSRMPDLLQYLRDLDIRTPQVAIKAKIILVNRTDIEALGFRYDLGTRQQFFSSILPRIDSAGSVIQGDRILLGGAQLSGIANANQRVSSPALSLAFSAALGDYDLTSFLDALSENQLSDIQAEPSIVTLDNRPAVIFSGEQIPFRVIDAGALGGGAGGNIPRATVQLVEAGIKLSVTPRVSFNRQVLLTVNAENASAAGATFEGNPRIARQQATNELLVADGETAVIGGLTVTSVTQNRAGIPFLKDLPFVGWIFRSETKSETKNDLLLLITPHILDEGERVDTPR